MYFEKFIKNLTDLKFRLEIPGEPLAFELHRDKLQEWGRAVLSTLFYDHKDFIPPDSEHIFSAEHCQLLGRAVLQKLFPHAGINVVTAPTLRNGIKVFYEGGREEVFDR
jgi:hypothetical protein